MSFTVLSHGVKQSTDSNGFGTVAVDATGGDLVVVGLIENPGSTGVITDNGNGGAGNAFASTVYSFTTRHSIWYAKNAICNASYVINVSGSGSFPGLEYWVVSGSLQTADPLDAAIVDGGSAGASVTTSSSGPVTPSVDNCLVVSVTGYADAASRSIAGFSTPDQLPLVGGVAYGLAGAYVIQGTKTAVTASWAYTPAAASDVLMAVFKPSLFTFAKQFNPLMGRQAVNRANTY